MTWLLLPLLVYLSLKPAWIKGPESGSGSAGITRAIVIRASLLNLLAVAVTITGIVFEGDHAFLWVPGICFCISANIGSVFRRKAWLAGPLSCFWFLIPTYGWAIAKNLARDMDTDALCASSGWLAITLACGVLGGLAVEIIWKSKR